MDTVSVSPKGQLVIPKKIRRQVGLEDGGVVKVELEGDRIILEPVERSGPGWRRWRGILRGTRALQEHADEHRTEAAGDAGRP